MKTDVVALILAGGRGSRLAILSEKRAKPAVPFAGIYRIIDFTMSNVMHALIPFVGILTQYRPYSLMDHISDGRAWGYTGYRRVAKILPPYVGEEDSDWYAGTADAVYQNLDFINRFEAQQVLILSGDHIYSMDYHLMLHFHRQKNADVTIAMQEVPLQEATRYGVAHVDPDYRVTGFQEKSSAPGSTIASLGIYVFKKEVLYEVLAKDAAQPESAHDFGKNIIPKIIKTHRVYSYISPDYWRDVGTIKSYWNTSMDALNPSFGLDLYRWDVRTNCYAQGLREFPPAKIGHTAEVANSIISRGCLIEGTVINSILSPRVKVHKNSRIEDSILFNDVEIKPDTKILRTIIDKGCLIGRNSQIGFGDNISNRDLDSAGNSGITVIGKGAIMENSVTIGKNCLIHAGVTDKALPERIIPSGSTIYPN